MNVNRNKEEWIVCLSKLIVELFESLLIFDEHWMG